MIRNINIAGVATYPTKGIKLDNLERINYFFGYNGCGKTTISRIIKDVDLYNGCKIKWENDKKLDTLVYNIDFINKNISDKIDGIFTLGEKNINIKNNIISMTEEIEKLREKYSQIKETISEEEDQLKKINKEFYDIMWNEKKNFTQYEKLFHSYNGSKEKFSKKIIEEYKKGSKQNIDEDIFSRDYNIVFSNETKTYDEIKIDTLINEKKILLSCENSPSLEKRIVGRDDTIISQFINTVGNSDWVHKGLNFLDEGTSKCPFCQQNINDDIKSQLETFFDKTYEKSLTEIKEIHRKYKKARESIILFMESIIRKIQGSLSVEGVSEKHETIENEKIEIMKKLDENIIKLEKKLDNPSIIIRSKDIRHTDETFLLIERDVSDINKIINEHNSLTKEKVSIKKDLDKKIWQLFINKNREVIKNYLSNVTKKEKILKEKTIEKENINSTITTKNTEKNNIEKSIVSIKPTIENINKLLETYDFKNFSLKNTEGTDNYIIVRPNGDHAINTLSEGEKSFISFLYFYFLIQGSTNEYDINKEKIIVIDDPVSSMDSNTSFIISTLIKQIIEHAHNTKEKKPNNIKQVFLLSHNAYFFNEVTYHKNIKGKTFWLITKKENISSIIRSEKTLSKNPMLCSGMKSAVPKRILAAILSESKTYAEEY